jgi:hypothetical protein
LTAALETLRVDGGNSKFKSFLQGIKTAWSARKIEETRKRLDEIQKALQFRILVLMKEDQAALRDEVLQSLDDVTRQVVISVLAGKDEIVRQQEISDRLAAQRHDQVVNLLSNNWTKSVDTADVLARIMAQLRHSAQDDRYDDIVEAHNDTFQWALQDRDGGTLSGPSLYEWLRAGDGVYWISGKAGSGKSTLMKFLYQDARLHDALKLWAGNSQLITIHFYFWSAGSGLQKSQEGLFRAILYQVLQQKPSLGPVLFPEQYLPGAKWPQFPTFHDLQRALSRFTRSLESSQRVAMLIDGLDEFDDAMNFTITELAEIFLGMTRSPNIKALLSSRPLAPFEFTFRQEPKLRLHDLTHKDITTYVNDKLDAHPRIVVLSKDHHEGVQALIKDIVGSAAGVFLWVKLVVRSLLEGLQNYDRLVDLERRLKELPHDLEELFRHMLRNIPAEYKTDSSRIFQIVRSHKASRVRRRLTALALYLTDTDEADVMNAPIAAKSKSELQQCEAEIEGRLRSRCAGLLEVRIHTEEWSEPDREEPATVSTVYVDYIHKTVADFLGKDDVWSEITRHTDQLQFNASTALLQSAVLQAKCTAKAEQPLFDIAEDIMAYARLAEDTLKLASLILLDELDRCMCVYFDAGIFTRSSKIYGWVDCALQYYIDAREDPWFDNILAFAVSRGLCLYVQAKLRKAGRSCLQKEGRPLLEYACVHVDPMVGGFEYSQSERIETIEVLLHHGADPNEAWGKHGRTVWQNTLQNTSLDLPKWIATLRLLLRYGADVSVCLESRDDRDRGQDDKPPFQRSVLRDVNIVIQHAILGQKRQDPANNDQSRGNWSNSQFPKYYFETGQIPPEIIKEFKTAADELVELLVVKGAKEWERHKDENGEWRQIYPEETVITSNTAEQASLSKSEFTKALESPKQIESNTSQPTTTLESSQQVKKEIPKFGRSSFSRLKRRLIRAKEP